MDVVSSAFPLPSPAGLRRTSAATYAAGYRRLRHPRAQLRGNSVPSVPSSSSSSSASFQPRIPFQYQPSQTASSWREEADDDDDESGEKDDGESAIGDCLVFEEDAFELGDPPLAKGAADATKINPKSAAKSENLIPEKWRDALEEINMSKKEKRKISWELKFGSKLERRKKLPLPDLEEYRAYRNQRLSKIKPVVLDMPREFPPPLLPKDVPDYPPSSGSRGEAKNPRLEIEDEGLDSISDFFNSPQYVPEENNDDKKPAKRKLFTQEEKILLNKRIPALADATSSKWLPVHAFAASGEFYLLDALLKHNVDVNAADKDGLCAIHRAILGNKMAIVNYLLRESANPFVKDREGATLMHYAVLTGSTQIIKTLLLYDVDINLADNEGWTPLHLAVQTLRTDVARLLLVKRADRNAKTLEGLTPLGLCLLSGHHTRTFEMIKLLKEKSTQGKVNAPRGT
ncbi:ankyrin repeat protein [Wolffia australiana]